MPEYFPLSLFLTAKVHVNGEHYVSCVVSLVRWLWLRRLWNHTVAKIGGVMLAGGCAGGKGTYCWRNRMRMLLRDFLNAN